MADEQDDQITHRVIKAQFTGADPKILARIRELSTMQPDKLPTDPKMIADDLQTVAGFALSPLRRHDARTP